MAETGGFVLLGIPMHATRGLDQHWAEDVAERPPMACDALSQAHYSNLSLSPLERGCGVLYRGRDG